MATVKYAWKSFRSKYRVSLKNKIKIEYLKTVLKIRRVKRLIKRIVINNVTNFINIIFMLCLIVGVSLLGIYLKEYNTIFEGIWEMKELLITNTMLLIFITTYTSEINWHKNLVSQYYTYYSIMCEADDYTNDILSLINYQAIDSIYIDEENHDVFCDKLSEIKINNCSNYKKRRISNQLKELNKEFIKKIEILTNEKEDFVGVYPFEVKEIIYDLESMCWNYKEHQDIRDYIISLSNYLYLLVAHYRKPWRWDLKVDKKIRSILEKDSTFIKGSFNRLYYYELPSLIRKDK